MLKSIIWTVLLFIASYQTNANSISITENKEAGFLSKGIQFYTDSKKDKSIDEIIKLLPDSFTKIEQVIPNFGQTNSVIWLALNLKNYTSEKLFLEAGNPLINKLKMYVVKEGKVVYEKQYGNHESFSQRDKLYNTFIIDPQILPDEEAWVFFRAESSQPIEIPLKSGNLEEIINGIMWDRSLDCIYFGFVLLMLLYNTLMAISIRDKIYLYYSMFTLGMLLMVGHAKGYTFQLLWPEAPVLNHYFATIYCIGIFTSLLFSFKFLKSKKYSPGLYKLSYLFYGLVGITVILDILEFNFGSTWLEMIVALIAIFYSISLGITAYLNGNKTARFYIVAWGFMQIGALTAILYYLNIIPYNKFTSNSLLWGSGLELLFLTIALSDKINYYKKSKEETQKLMIKELKEKQHLKDSMNHELERQVEERTRELTAKNRQVDMLVYKASHDIKGPLRSITSLTKIALKDLEKYPEAIKYLEHINVTTTRLSQIVTDLLNLAKIKETRIKPEMVNLQEVISNILQGLQHLPEAKRIKIEVDMIPGMEVFTDKKLLYSIIQNFIENGIKYSDPEKLNPYLKTSISVSGKKLHLNFEDNGLGMDKEHLEKIFDMFYKIDSESNGTGMGLYLVKEAIEKLNGSIQCKSKKLKGTKFKIILPMEVIDSSMITPTNTNNS